MVTASRRYPSLIAIWRNIFKREARKNAPVANILKKDKNSDKWMQERNVGGRVTWANWAHVTTLSLLRSRPNETLCRYKLWKDQIAPRRKEKKICSHTLISITVFFSSSPERSSFIPSHYPWVVCLAQRTRADPIKWQIAISQLN